MTGPAPPLPEAPLAVSIDDLPAGSSTQHSGGGGAAGESSDAAEDDGGADESGVPITYWDGDVQRTVWMQRSTPASGGAAGAAGRSTAGLPAGEDLVFQTLSGREMRLPGGVTLVLDPDWTSAQVDAFLRRNGIAAWRVGPLGSIGNGFIVETVSGLASLRLANALAAQDGVILSSPNWAAERVTE